MDAKIYFLATAEDTQSTYNDGEVKGSLIGVIDVATMKLEFTQKISDTHKFEGLTLIKIQTKPWSFCYAKTKIWRCWKRIFIN